MAKFSGHISDVDLNLLRIFRAVAECGGISSAETMLNVGRSTISRQISELEQRLGVTLCERGRSGFRLTNEGRLVLSRLSDLMGAVEDFRRHVAEIRNEIAGELILALPDAIVGAAYDPLPRVVAKFVELAPNVRINLKKFPPDEIERELGQRRCHIGLRTVTTKHKGFYYEHLAMETNEVFCGSSHPLATRVGRSVPESEIYRHKIAVLTYKSGLPRKWGGLQIEPAAYANDLDGLANLILSGRFLGFLPENYGQHFVVQGKMAKVQNTRLRYEIPFQAVLLEHEEKTIASRTMLDCLVRYWTTD